MTEAAGPVPRTPSAPTLDPVSEEVRELSEDRTGADAGTQDAVLLFVGGPLDGYLATTPGGMNAVLATATATGADTTFVLAVQVLRLFAMLLSAPLIARLLRRWAEAT